MLLKLFKATQTGLLLFLVFTGTALWVLQGYKNQQHIISISIGFIMVISISALWNYFINRNSLLNQSTFFPLFFCFFLLSCHPKLLCFYPAQAGMLLLLLAMVRLAGSVKKEKAFSDVFDSGLLIGIASLACYNQIVFLFFLLIGLIIIRYPNWREWLIAVLGFLLPFILLLEIRMLLGNSFGLPMFAFPNIQGFSRFSYPLSIPFILFCAGISVPFSVSLWYYLTGSSSHTLKIQKFRMLIMLFLIISGLQVVLSVNKNAEDFSTFAIPVSFIMSNYFLKAKTSWFSEFIFLLFLMAVIAMFI